MNNQDPKRSKAIITLSGYQTFCHIHQCWASFLPNSLSRLRTTAGDMDWRKD